MDLGAAWYPEHWPEERWLEDVRLMVEAGMTVTRIGEFAWSSMEPNENHYQFEWLERAIDVLAASGIKVVLGTPTAAPPAWLTYHHPDTLAIEPNGRPAQHGNRCHYSPTSSTYHKYARRIVEQMARRFGRDERVIGWQIDNEYNRVDYSENSRRQFQAYLRDQFGTLDSLNSHWSTAYWSQTYTDWNEIPMPIGGHNPGLMLAFRHFVTKVWRDFQRMQADAIRQQCREEQWITHNFMGWFDAFDHYALAEDLDMASWDWYVGAGHNDYTKSGAVHDLTRGLKRRNFWLMETQPGSVNWSPLNNVLNRGEARAMAWHATAHGADAVLYWQWRSAPGGQEQMHGSLLGQDGAPRPFYDEVKRLGSDFARAGDALADTEPQSDVAFLHSYDSRWSIDWQRHNREFDPIAHFVHYYQPFARRSIGVDVISARAALRGYKLVVAPALVIITPEIAASLQEFVNAGGTLVLTVRCGQRDGCNALLPELPPGPLQEIAGVVSEEFYALDTPAPLTAEWGASTQGESRLWAERLRVISPDTRILATWEPFNGWLDGHPAVTEHPSGAGRVVVVGAVMAEALQESFTEWLIREAGVAAEWGHTPPEGVEVRRRARADGSGVTIVINHSRERRQLDVTAADIGQGTRDLLSGETMGAGPLVLEPYDIRVFSA